MNKVITNKDEYYTLYEDIKNELQYYTKELTGKSIYCNCDNPQYSNFVKYFRNNFERLELKELIASYRNLDGTGGVATYNGLDWTYRELQNGSYDSKELTEYLNRADVVVTNPPYSQLASYLTFLLDNNKDFITMGNITVTNSATMFEYFKNQQIHLGRHIDTSCWFVVPKDNYNQKNTKIIDEKYHLRIGNITWWTTFPDKNIKPKCNPTVSINNHDYDRYFNYDAINVNRVKDIPKDYYGEMGVPVTYLSKHNPQLFDIIGLSNVVPKTRQDVPKYKKDVWIEKNGKPWKAPFKRIIIKRRKI